MRAAGAARTATGAVPSRQTVKVVAAALHQARAPRACEISHAPPGARSESARSGLATASTQSPAVASTIANGGRPRRRRRRGNPTHERRAGRRQRQPIPGRRRPGRAPARDPAVERGVRALAPAVAPRAGREVDPGSRERTSQRAASMRSTARPTGARRSGASIVAWLARTSTTPPTAIPRSPRRRPLARRRPVDGRGRDEAARPREVHVETRGSPSARSTPPREAARTHGASAASSAARRVSRPRRDLPREERAPRRPRSRSRETPPRAAGALRALRASSMSSCPRRCSAASRVWRRIFSCSGCRPSSTEIARSTSVSPILDFGGGFGGPSPPLK